MSNISFESPLQWLPQQPRTNRPKRSAFKVTSTSRAGNDLFNELKLLGAKKIIVSSNLRTRLDEKGFLSNQRIDDMGVVVYFDLKGDSKAMACDKWNKVEHNLWALRLSIAAIRGLERWGGSEFLDGLFTGFKALPSPDSVFAMSVTDYFSGYDTEEEIRLRYKSLCKELHPDMGGSTDEFNELTRQYKLKVRE